MNYISELMKKCVGRMEDMASTVRKSAFQLLCDLIRNNPFGIKIIELEKESIQRECEKEEEALQKLVDENDKLVEELDELVVNAGTQANGKPASKARRGKRRGGRDSLSTTSEESEDQEARKGDAVASPDSAIGVHGGAALGVRGSDTEDTLLVDQILARLNKVSALDEPAQFQTSIESLGTSAEPAG